MKRLVVVLLMIFLLTGTPILANAAPELSLDSPEVLQGQTASLNFSLAGGIEEYAGINVTIQLPGDITASTVSKGELLPSDFTLDHSSDGNKVRIIAYSADSTFSQNGSLFSLNIEADADASPGEQDIVFVTDSSGLLNPNALSNSDGSKSVSPVLKNGKITILKDEDGDGLSDDWEMQYFGNLDQGADDNPDEDGFTNSEEYENGTNPTQKDSLPGDLNGDNIVDLRDAILALQISCGMTTSDSINKAGDVNNDGKIGVDEAAFILQKIGN